VVFGVVAFFNVLIGTFSVVESSDSFSFAINPAANDGSCTRRIANTGDINILMSVVPETGASLHLWCIAGRVIKGQPAHIGTFDEQQIEGKHHQPMRKCRTCVACWRAAERQPAQPATSSAPSLKDTAESKAALSSVTR
jgi:hypothetical protein